MRAHPNARAVSAPSASISASYSHCQPASFATPLASCICGSHVNSRGFGHPAVDSCSDIYSALTGFNQTFFESLAKAKTAWSQIMAACRRIGIDVADKTMPTPKIKEPSPHYKKTRAEDTAIATFAVAIESDDAPEWIELLPAGKFSAVDGRGPFENADPDKIIAASVSTMPQVGLVLDYDHSTDLAAPEGRPSIAAGWIKQFKVEQGAIFARIEWTAKAAEALKAKEYRYVSPVFEHGKDGKVERILRAALTNNPALINLPAIASAQKPIDPHEASKMKEEMSLAELMKRFPAKEGESALAHGKRLIRHLEAESASDEDEGMGALPDWAGDEEKEQGMEDRDSPEDEAESEEDMARRHEEEMAACNEEAARRDMAARHSREAEKMRRRKEEAARQNRGLEVKAPAGGGPAEEARARMSRFNAAIAKHPMVVQMASDLNQLRLAQARKTAENAVDQAIREGRLIPSQRDWAIEYCSGDPRGFEKFIGAAPRILQHGTDGTFTGRIGEAPRGAAMLERREIEIFANLGLESREQLEKCAAVKQEWTLRFPRPRLILDSDKRD